MNREIDKEIAEFMGWLQVKALPDRCVNHPRWFIVNLDEIIYIDDFHVRNVFKPTERIQDAFMVVEKMKEENDVRIEFNHQDEFTPDNWICCIIPNAKNAICAEADSAPMAICLAALEAIRKGVTDV